MNFAAQLFYSSYLSERLERLYSPKLALKDGDDNDPFWQRWEFTTSSPQDAPELPSSSTDPVATDLPSAQSSELDPTSTLTPPSPPPRLQPNVTDSSSDLKSLPLPPSPVPFQERKTTRPTLCPPSPCLAAVIPKSRVCQCPPVDHVPQTSLSSAGKTSPSSSSSSAPAPYRGDRLPDFQTLIDLLLHLFLYFVLLPLVTELEKEPKKSKANVGLKR